jgi:hypothetical protein
MPSTFDTTEPPEWFTPPGTVQVTAPALELARDFAEHARTARPDEEWIVSFDWADSRRIRLANNQWEELGAGIDLTAYERRNVPGGATRTVDGVEFAIKIPSPVYEKSAKLIDRDDTARSKLTLR